MKGGGKKKQTLQNTFKVKILMYLCNTYTLWFCRYCEIWAKRKNKTLSVLNKHFSLVDTAL